MITCDLRGQLGNQMFIAATVIAHAAKMNTSFAFPKTSGKRGQFPFMFPHLPQEPSRYSCEQFKEKKFGVYEQLPANDNLHLIGYFQSEKYFKYNREEIIDYFNFLRFPIKKGVVSIHIRRGDSLKFQNKLPQPTRRYLLEAMNMFKGYRFYVFSDDIEWCREHFIGDQFLFSLETDPKNELSKMSACEHNIIVNSTFSWWGAWLNQNPNKIVVAPHKDSWFSKNYESVLSAQDIIPDIWIQVKY